MLKLVFTTQFRRDVKRIKKQGRDIARLNAVLELLQAEEKLPFSYRDHPLVGNYLGFRECHVAPDWLLIYEIREDEMVLAASRTGSHAELFGK